MDVREYLRRDMRKLNQQLATQHEQSRGPGSEERIRRLEEALRHRRTALSALKR